MKTTLDNEIVNAIGEKMLLLAEDLLIKPIRPWLDKNGGIKIDLKLSNRKDSFCRCFGDSSYEIVIGKKSIRNKFDKSRAGRSQIGFEILEYKYFEGVLNPCTALAHTLAHELAHVFYFVKYDKRAANYHDDYFYWALGRIHNSGRVDDLYCEISSFLSQQGLLEQSFYENNFFPEEVVALINKLNVTDDVFFEEKGVTYKGIIKDIKPHCFNVSSGLKVYSVPKYGIQLWEKN